MFGFFLGRQRGIRQWWVHGKTQIQLLQQHTLNVSQDITRSMKDLETVIVELEKMSASSGERGYIEILKEKKLALANLLDTKVQGALVIGMELQARLSLKTSNKSADTIFQYAL